MGQTAREYVEGYLKAAGRTSERAIEDGKLGDAEAADLRQRDRLKALEYLVNRLAREVDGLEADEATRRKYN
jgi:hypothetical protein